METITNEATERITERIIRENVGDFIAKLLGLRRKRNGRFFTTWGDKTNEGLYNTLKRVIEEKLQNVDL